MVLPEQMRLVNEAVPWVVGVILKCAAPSISSLKRFKQNKSTSMNLVGLH